MATKITFNGVTYDSVDAMPPEARRLYDQMMSKLPELTARNADGIPDILQDLPARMGTSVRKQFVVNGVTYDDVEKMPPNVRQAYELAMRTASAAGTPIKENEIKVSFQMNGPHVQFRLGSGKPGGAPITLGSTTPGSIPAPDMPAMPRPIEPSSGGAASRIAFLLGVAAAISIAAWLWVAHR